MNINRCSYFSEPPGQSEITSNTSTDSIKKSVDGVIIRLGYRGYGNGALKLDTEFTNNLNACKLRGIPYGFYFFTQAVNGIVKKCAVGEYPKSEIDRYQAA